jgi:nucleoside-diphosphate-sugar epimerase
VKAIIVGAGGFIGHHVAGSFERGGWEVCRCRRTREGIAVDLPGGGAQGLDEALAVIRPDVVVNAAGNGFVPASWTDPMKDFDANTVLVLKLLEALRRSKAPTRFVNVSSAAVYGEPVTLPISEDHPCAPLSPYGWHKRLAEMMCVEYATLHGVKAVSCRGFSVFGPGQRKLLVWDLMEQLRTRSEVSLRGTGKEMRDFVYVADFASAIEAVARNAEGRGEAFNVASGTGTRISDIASMLARVAGFKGRIAFDGQPMAGYPLNWQADIGKLTRAGFAQAHTLESGLAATWDWYCSQAHG